MRGAELPVERLRVLAAALQRVQVAAEARLELAEDSTFPSFGWSADGAELLISAWDDGSGESSLRRYSIDSGESAVVSTPHTLIGRIAWSPTGRLVAMDANIPGSDRTRAQETTGPPPRRRDRRAPSA